MTTELENILDVVNRLDAKRFALPARLPRQHDRDHDRDRPTRHSGSITAPKHDHRLHRQPQQHVWNWRSKAV